jgi:hypothetical protein
MDEQGTTWPRRGTDRAMPTVDELRALHSSDPSSALAGLLELFVAEEHDMARPAKAALIDWPDPSTSARLGDAAVAWQADHSSATAHAMEVLGRRRDETGLPAILAVLAAHHPSKKGNPVLFRQALFGLAAFHTPEALAALRDGLHLPLTLLDDDNRLEKVTAGLAELADPATAYELLRDCITEGGNDKLTTRAIFIIGEAVKAGRAVDPRWSDVAFAFRASKSLTIATAAQTMLLGIEHPERTNRLFAVADTWPPPQPVLSALGRTRDPRALPLLLRAMEAPAAGKRSPAASTLAMTGAAGLRWFGDAELTTKGVAFLVAELRENASTWEQGAATVVFGCKALAAVGDRAPLADVKTILAGVAKRGAKKKDEKAARERMVAALEELVKALEA